MLVLSAETSSPSEAAYCLREVLKTIQADSTPCTSYSLNSLREINKKFGYQLVRPLWRVYRELARVPSNNEPSLAIALAQDVYKFCDSMINTEMANELEESALLLLQWLSTSRSLSSEEIRTLSELVKARQVDFDELVKKVMDELVSDDSYGVTRLMEAFSSLSSIQEQYFFFGNKLGPVVKVLKHTRNKETLGKIILLLDHFVFQLHFSVIVSGSELESPGAHLYTVVESKCLSSHNSVFFTVIALLRILICSELHIPFQIIKILQRL